MNYRKELMLTVSQWLELKEVSLSGADKTRFAAMVSKEYQVLYNTTPNKITTKSLNTGKYTNKAYGYKEEEFQVLETSLDKFFDTWNLGCTGGICQVSQESIESLSVG